MNCYANSLNLAVQDGIKASIAITDALNITNEITKLFKASVKREAWLER